MGRAEGALHRACAGWLEVERRAALLCLFLWSIPLRSGVRGKAMLPPTVALARLSRLVEGNGGIYCPQKEREKSCCRKPLEHACFAPLPMLCWRGDCLKGRLPACRFATFSPHRDRLQPSRRLKGLCLRAGLQLKQFPVDEVLLKASQGTLACVQVCNIRGCFPKPQR